VDLIRSFEELALALLGIIGDVQPYGNSVPNGPGSVVE